MTETEKINRIKQVRLEIAATLLSSYVQDRLISPEGSERYSHPNGEMIHQDLRNRAVDIAWNMAGRLMNKAGTFPE